jgi:sphingomyelin phosphodiesterase 2
MQLRVLTLNIWGVRYVSKFIDRRIQALIEHLTNIDTNYDIVALQEVTIIINERFKV